MLNHSTGAYSPEYGPAVRAGEEFAAAAREAGLWYAGVVCADTAGEGRLAFERLMAEHPEVTAVAAMSDQAAVGVLQAVEERGWRVPGDLSLLLASASARVAEMFRPRLTTLEPPGAELGRLGARMLIDRLESPGSPPAQRLVPCRLVIGDSSAPPRGSGAAR
ncbi:substrate-binding domain-containing protein [Nonomuraea sp. NPDC050478]|uniref:substrate-binding domain-containing protein n=1 Tax=Nonomuraea sp. NPDC050478 TaxID=3364365 RepID=UPI0037B8BD34